MKVLIGVLSSERNNFSWYFIDSLIRLVKFMGKDGIVSYVHSGTIPDGRNAILDLAKQNQCDYALMIDSDMTFPSNGAYTLMRDMATFDASIGCGLYFGTYPPFQSMPLAFDEIAGKQVPLDDWSKTRYITSCGMGFTLIHCSLFNERFEFKPNLGEDHLFCKVAREKGHKVILVPSVKCGHLRTIPIDEEIAKKLYGNSVQV